MIKRILLPLDGSRFAEAAVPLARNVATAVGDHHDHLLI